MKILILAGSPRINGNSNTLVNSFIKGAKENGHEVVKFDCGHAKIHPCMACDKCERDGVCAFADDDFRFVRENIIDADMVIFASPMYYFGISAQLKTVIDRFYGINTKLMGVRKKSAFFLTYAEDDYEIAQSAVAQYKDIISYMGWQDSGVILAKDTWSIGDINNTEYLKDAYSLGKAV